MARGVNKVILIGNLGNDPDVRSTQSGSMIATLSVATTTSRKDRDGNWQDKTEWHRVKVFGKTAETAQRFLTKGSQVYIEGRLEYGSYDKDGVKHYTTDIVADEMQMIGSGDGQRGGGEGGGGYQQRGGGEGGGYQRGGGGGYGGGDRPQRSAPAQRREPAQAPAKPAFDDVPFDDDIPF